MHAKLYTILIITLTCGVPHRVSGTRDIYIAMEERRDCFGDHHCRLARYLCNSHVLRQTGAFIPDFDEYAIKGEGALFSFVRYLPLQVATTY